MDSSLARAERDFAQDASLDHEIALLRARARAGEIGPEDLALAGLLGSEAALQVSGQEARPVDWGDLSRHGEVAKLRAVIACTRAIVLPRAAPEEAPRVLRAVQLAERELLEGEELEVLITWELLEEWVDQVPAETCAEELIPWLLGHPDPVRARVGPQQVE